MKKNIKILVIDDEVIDLNTCQILLGREGYNVKTAVNGQDGLRKINEEDFDVIILDLNLPDINGMEILKNVRANFPGIVVIIITAYSSVQSAVDAIKLGAADYISKPFNPEDFILLINKVSEENLNIKGKVSIEKKNSEGKRFGDIIGSTEKMKKIFQLITKVSETNSTVLITGESGTGKELIARAIYNNSSRKNKPFVPIDCAALPETLLESVLFGHVKGSFTGAILTKAGLLEIANGGTVFFDEIGNFNLYIQGKLLRVIQEREFTPVGGTSRKKIDVRIIAATNKNLELMLKDGKLREDLFYRLNVVPIHVPPLRERKSDIPALVYYFINKFNEKANNKIEYISPNTMNLFTEYDWPGNIRELENIIERLIVTHDGKEIHSEHLPSNFYQSTQIVKEIPKNNEELKKVKKIVREKLYGEIEKNFLTEALKRNNWNITKAAKEVGIQRSNFQTMMKKNKISTKQYK